mmetsp:Transcript_31232/g.57157  ORF Transcript_31232/g.57157 Transcript_31232/m.57157 type:complete len:82 (+) Transcript_31232:1492-1737(+)
MSNHQFVTMSPPQSRWWPSFLLLMFTGNMGTADGGDPSPSYLLHLLYLTGRNSTGDFYALVISHTAYLRSFFANISTTAVQ